MMAGSRVIAFHTLQVRDDENLKEDSGNYIDPPVTTVIAVKRNHGPNKPPHDPRPCQAYLNGLRPMPTFSHAIFHTFLRHVISMPASNRF